MNTTFTNYAAKAKQFLNLLQGYTKGIRLTAIFILLLMGVSNAWAATIFNCGIEVNETWYKGTGTINSGNWLGNLTAFNNKDFGVITSLNLGGQYDTWDDNKTDDCSGNASNGITITIKKGSTQKDQFKLSCYHSGREGNNNVWKTTGTIGKCGDKNAYGRYTHNISQYAAGNDYTIAAKWFSPSGISTTGTAKFTIPGFTTTSKSQTFDSTPVGNNNSKTISFGTHYGTTLKTNNCSISGTNYTEFSVTSINESGVTVQFKPTSAGSKTATLTITDEHNKTCTITLSGSAQSPTPTITITSPKVYLKHGTDKLTLNITYKNIPTDAEYEYAVHVTDIDQFLPDSTTRSAYNVISGSGSVDYATNNDIAWRTTPYTVNVKLYKKNYRNTVIAQSNDISITVENSWAVNLKVKTDGNLNNTGGSIVTNSNVVYPTAHNKEQIEAKPNPGYAFTGWTTNREDAIFFDDASALCTNVSATIASGDAYANYTETKHNVTIKANNNTYGTVSPGSINVGQHTASSPITATQNAGCRFVSWTATPGITIANTNSPSTTITATQGGTLTANFEEIKHNITVVSSNNAHGTVDKSSVEVGQHTASEQIKATAKTGYKFVSWTATDGITITNSTNATTTIKATKAGTLTANFEEDLSTSWSLAHSIDDFKTNTHLFIKKTGESTGKVAYVSLDLAANTTYQFKVVTGKTWYGNNNYNEGDKKWWIKATMNDPWEFYSDAGDCYMQSALAGTYTFKIDYSSTYPQVSVYYPEIYALVGSFNNWNENTNKFIFDGNIGTSTVDLQGSATNYEFKIIDNGVHGGMTSKTITKTEANMAITVGGGDNIKLTANVYPNGEYVFTYDKSTKKLSVTYPIAHTITYGVGDDGNGIVSESSDIKSGTLLAKNTSISLNATPNLGYKFEGWYDDPTCENQVSTDNPYTFQIISNTARYAKFVERDLYIHTDIIGWGTAAKMEQDDTNKAVYTYTITGLAQNATNGADYNTGYHFRFTTKEPSELVYNWDLVKKPIDYEGASIDGVNLTDPRNPTIQFGLTKKSDVTITLTLQSAIEDQKDQNTWPTVHIAATPYYNITWKDENDQVIETTEPNGLKQGSPLTLPEVEPRMGYKFVGWNTAKDGTGSAPTQTVEGDATYYQVWEERLLYIKANWLNDIGGYTQMTRNSDSEYTYQLNSMHPTTYAFQICDKNGEEYQLAYCYTNVQEPTTSSTFITNIGNKMDDDAEIQFNLERWSDLTITLTLKSANDDPKPTVELSSVPYYTLTYDLNYDAQPNRIFYFEHLLSGANIKIAEGTPTRPGYTWTGWNSEIDGTGEAPDDSKQMGEQDRTYYAQWTPATYTIALDHEGGSGTQSVQATYGSAMPTITIPTRTDHLFMGYYDGDNGTGTQYYNADGTSAKNWDKTDNTTLHARWIPYSQCIFFKNTLGWNNVYVYTFSDNVWYDNEDSNTQYGPGVCTKVNVLEFAKMTQIDNTDIYYYILTKQAGFNHIAFSDANMNNCNEFYGNNAIYRADRNDQLPLFIPKKSQTPTTTNSTKYYSSGIWMKYNSTESGYDWRGATDENNQEQWSKKFDFTASKPGGYSFTATVEFDNTSTHYFKIHNTKGDWFGNGGTMTQNNCTNWIFGSDNSNNAKITPTITGTYIFTIYLGDGEVSVSLDYPLSTGDYRLVYVDDVTGAHPGHYIKKRNEERLDTVSFFVHSQNSPRIWLQYCTEIDQNGEATWAPGKEYQILKTGGANPATAQLPGKRKSDAVLHVGEGCGIEESGVYNFVLQQSNSQAELFTDATHLYVGNFYIRTDAAEGGWDSFRQKSNQITYSSFADKHSNFNHYYCKYIDAGRNVKFTIANDYSYCISDTLDNDDIIKDGQSSLGCLPSYANVRFGWNSNTNELSRAYISGSSNVSDRFLVLEGNKYLKDINGNALNVSGLYPNEAIFSDKQNWIYQLDVQANSNTEITLTAKYNKKVQTFFGTSKSGFGGEPIMQATNEDYHKVRMIYDFKTNNLIAAWLLNHPTQETEATSVASNMLIIREDQRDANQINFTNNQNMVINTAYAVMTFTKDWVTGAATRDRSEYWVSFPFDVKISDVFGFSEYGDQWIMQLYDGAERAEKGNWIDSPTFWKYITNRNYTLKAGVGYVLKLNPSKMTFDHGATDVSLFFPSQGTTTIINAEPTPITVPAHTCTIERDNRNIYDSHWNLIGVPGYANLDTVNTKYTTGNQPENVSFYYAYNAASNSYEPAAATATFKNMYAYMVQFAGTIDWKNDPQFNNIPQQLAARRNSDSNEPEKLTMRLEIAQGEEMADQTFVQLQQEGATPEFDMNLDLTKIINSGANIYTLVGNSRIQTAGNALPMDEAMVVPVGVKIDAEGEYTFRMPDGTEGMVVELVDYETNNRTNLLLTDYTVTLPKGTNEYRFALHIQPQKDVVTSLENIGEGVNNGEAVNKYLIDGKLIIRTADGVVYDAQGKRL